MTKKRAIVSVINDLATDQRVKKTCMVLIEKGYDVILIGRKLPGSLALQATPYKCVRMNLLFKKGPAFYFFFNLRLFLFLLFKKAELLVANDLDTLGPNYRVSRWKKCKLIYDSHEIFTEVPELVNRPRKKQIWERLEKKIVPRLKFCITVNESIANWFYNRYNVTFKVVRNIPAPTQIKNVKTKSELNLPAGKKIILLQGAGINIDRGAEELVEAMKFVEGVLLLIIGSGDVIGKLKEMVATKGLAEKITFKNKMPAHELFHYTKNADLGLTIDKNTNLNYRFSLPNKIFDYCNAGIPVLASRLTEIEKFITKYDIGNFIENHSPKHIAEKITESLWSTHYSEWKKNTLKAAEENSWEKEKKVWENLLDEISNQSTS